MSTISRLISLNLQKRPRRRSNINNPGCQPGEIEIPNPPRFGSVGVNRAHPLSPKPEKARAGILAASLLSNRLIGRVWVGDYGQFRHHRVLAGRGWYIGHLMRPKQKLSIIDHSYKHGTPSGLRQSVRCCMAIPI